MNASIPNNKLQRTLKRNEFWKTIRQELPKLGLIGFWPEEGSGLNLYVIVPTWDPSKQAIHNIRYPFPRHHAKKFSTALNFRTQLKNFIKYTMQEKGLLPPDAAGDRQPSRAVQKLHLPQNLPTPTPQDTAVLQMPPVNPDDPDITIERVFAPKPKNVAVKEPESIPTATNEPMILAMFNMPASQLQLVKDTLAGLATFIGEVPLTTMIVQSPKEEPVLVEPAQVLLSSTPDSVRSMTQKRTRISRASEKEAIVKAMMKRPTRVWSVEQIAAAVPNIERDLVAKCLFTMAPDRVVRIGHGQYRLRAA